MVDFSSLLRVCLTAYCGMLVYNFISAVLGLCLLRRIYVGLLRRLYRLLGSKMRSSGDRRDGDKHKGSAVYSGLPHNRSFATFRHEFQLEDACNFITSGLEVVTEDGVTKSFTTEEVEEWNFLTRTQMQTDLGLRLEILLYVSIVFRFAMFFIIRLPIGISGIIWLFFTVCILCVLNFLFPRAQWRRKVERYCSIVCSRLIASALSAVINIKNRENRAKCGSVCVANHTTPIDIVMLAVDNSFTLVGQRHGGFTGIIQSACNLAQKHIWFERKVAKDRKMVTERLKEHIADQQNNPILIFPEGTCINNTGVFMFKKGCFELGAMIHPVVIKYRREFADPFWNSQEQNMLTYLFMLMTSWAIVCDVEYLEPTTIGENETAIEFAQRVKQNICLRGGLVDLPWDGMVKRPGNESYLMKVVEEERKAYSQGLEVFSPSEEGDDDDEDDGDTGSESEEED